MTKVKPRRHGFATSGFPYYPIFFQSATEMKAYPKKHESEYNRKQYNIIGLLVLTPNKTYLQWTIMGPASSGFAAADFRTKESTGSGWSGVP